MRLSQPRHTLLPLLGLALLGSLSCVDISVHANPVETETRLLERGFSADRPVRLANLAGRVRVVPGTGSEVRVKATLHAAGKDPQETRRLLSALDWVEADDVLGGKGWALSYPVGDYRGFAYPRESHGGRFLGAVWHNNTRYRGRRVTVYGGPKGGVPVLFADLEVAVPPGARLAVRNVVGSAEAEGMLSGDLTLDTGSGDVVVASVDGDLSVDTGSGDVEIERVRGRLLVDTGSGSVLVGRLEGDGDLDTGSGDVVLRSVQGGRLRIDTGSGSIRVEGGRVDQVEADTGSGDVELLNLEAVTIVADTGSGDVDLSGSLEGTQRIDVDTGSGDVMIAGGPAASFALDARLGSGEVDVRYADAELIRHGREVVGARRGDARTRIVVETGSGNCTVRPGR